MPDRQGSRHSPADLGRLSAADTGPDGDRRPGATWDGRGGRGPPAGREARPGGRCGEAAARGRAQPVVPSSAGRPARPRPVSRLSNRPPRSGELGWPEEPQQAGLCGPGCPAGRGRRAREKCTQPGAEAPLDPG
ncbi:uncharacterized protein LOC110990922 [Acanthaster planci]|uniref:Uncharacterized protein LOC110990922 n=1 Tax=Acanthaster planci TaxID=133434 RepID=A0A8B8A1Y3_ACAPL|nr:uncharacterized protein LOC110990922 [Acanthaster planci]